jgi:hypothetical protein
MDLIYTAVTTLIAGAISSYLTIKLTLKKDLVNTRRDRLEKFAFSLFAIDELLEDYRDKYLFGKDEILINELHLNQIEMLCKLYFKSIENELSEFENEIRRYKVLMFQSQLELIKIQRAGDVLRKPLPSQKMMDECTDLIGLIDDKKNLLLKALLEKYPLLD